MSSPAVLSKRARLVRLAIKAGGPVCAVLAAVAYLNWVRPYRSAVPTSDARSAVSDVEDLSRAVKEWQAQKGALPGALEDLVPAHVKELKRDPWGQSYKLVRRESLEMEVCSYGADRMFGGTDDVCAKVGFPPAPPAAAAAATPPAQAPAEVPAPAVPSDKQAGTGP